MRVFMFWLIVIITVMVDQTTKAAAIEVLEDGPQVLLPGLVNLIYVENTGAAFSIGEGAGMLFIVFALVFLIGSVYLVTTSSDMPLSLVASVGFIAGGGLGNMVDRIVSGSITDFLSLAFMDFPVFNVADICVTLGVVCTVIGYWKWDAERERLATGQIDSNPHDGFDHA